MADQSQFPAGERVVEMPVWAFALLPLLLFALSFGTRMVAIGRYVTPDEPTWVYRSVEFREALLGANWSQTLVAGHPGVTTTWLGALGMSAQMLLSPESRDDYDWLTQIAYLTPDNVEAFKRLATLMTGGRIAVVAVNCLGIALLYLLVKRLWGWRVALAGGLLLAFDPFLAGLSGLLHVDGLSSTFVTLSLLATAVGLRGYAQATRGRGAKIWPIMAGVAAGLAVLTKSPGLLLVPFTGLALLWLLVAGRERPTRRRLLDAVSFGLLWGLAFLATVVVLFPAIWTAPDAVWQTLSGSANRHLDEALRQTFFLGEAAFVHGPLFYPVTLLWRLSPVAWVGLILAAVWMIKNGRKLIRVDRDVSPLLLAMWAILFILAITPAAKKFDRYILPVVPSLLILSALGWASLKLSSRRLERWVLPIAVLAQIVYWFFFAAYPLSAYNPLVGGPWTAVRVLPIGWGESISASGDYLSRAQADVEDTRAISGIAPSLAPFYSGTTLVYGYDNPASADFVIVTQGGRQLDPAEFEAQTQGLTLIHTEHYGGLDQAWVYERDSVSAEESVTRLPEPAIFDNRMSLVAYGQEVEGETITISAEWRRLGALAEDERFLLRIVISDEAGNIWASHETDLLDAVYFYPPDWAADESGVVRYVLELPPGIPPSSYSVGVSLIDNRTAGQLPVRIGDGAFQGVVYRAGEVQVSPPESIISASRMQIPNAGGTTWLDDTLQLLGYGDVAAEALAGSQLPVELFWHAPRTTLPPGLMISWQLAGGEESGRVLATMPLSRYDTGMWRLGESIHEKYLVPIPPDLPPGRYDLTIAAHGAGEAAGMSAPLGSIRINNIERSYTLPDDIPVQLDVLWEPLALLGMGPANLSGAPGETIDLDLLWEKRAPYGDVYSVFVHIVDEDGNIVSQSDHWPGGLPTDILDGGQIVIDRMQLELPDDLAPGSYEVRVGLYSAADGQRLPIVGGAGAGGQDAADYVILPIPLLIEPR